VFFFFFLKDHDPERFIVMITEIMEGLCMVFLGMS